MNGKAVAQESLLFSPTVRSQAIQLTSQKQDFPICQLKTIIMFAYFQAVVRIKWKCQSVICKMLSTSKELGSN